MKKIFQFVVVGAIALLSFGFITVSYQTKTSKTKTYNTKDICIDNLVNYNTNQTVYSVLIKIIHDDEKQTVKIMQIKGHEYFIYVKKPSSSVAMVHSASCFKCTVQDKNGK